MTNHAVSSKVLLDVKNLKMHFPIKRGFLAARTVGYVKAECARLAKQAIAAASETA